MPRVIDVTAVGFDSNGKQQIEVGGAFLSKPSKDQIREYFNSQINDVARKEGINVGSINTVEVTGPQNIHDVYTFSTTKTTGTKKTTSKHKSVSTSVGSKKDQAIQLFKANVDKSRKEIIQLFVEQLDMTPAGAATYYSTAKKNVE